MNGMTIAQYQCPVCGKVSDGRRPKGGDLTLIYPRRHDFNGRPCPGNIQSANWLEVEAVERGGRVYATRQGRRLAERAFARRHGLELPSLTATEKRRAARLFLYALAAHMDTSAAGSEELDETEATEAAEVIALASEMAEAELSKIGEDPRNLRDVVECINAAIRPRGAQ